MTIWEVIPNNEYRNFCLINENHQWVTDFIIHFEGKQENTSFVRTICTLEGDNHPLGDIMNYSSMRGTFLVNQKAKKVLQENFDGIQFFDTVCAEYPEEKFFLLNIFNYQDDVLDTSRSEYKSVKNRYGEFTIGHITSYVFQEKAFELDMFKIVVNGRKYTRNLFVSDKFKRVIEENHLTGLCLRKVYELGE